MCTLLSQCELDHMVCNGSQFLTVVHELPTTSQGVPWLLQRALASAVVLAQVSCLEILASCLGILVSFLGILAFCQGSVIFYPVIVASFLGTLAFYLENVAFFLETEVSTSMENVAYVQAIGTFVFQEIVVSYLAIEVSSVQGSVIFYLYLVTEASCLLQCRSLW